MSCTYNKQFGDVIEWRKYVDDVVVRKLVTDDAHYVISSSDYSSTLQFNDVTPEMAADYACHLVNEGVSANATLVVLGKRVFLLVYCVSLIFKS